MSNLVSPTGRVAYPHLFQARETSYSDKKRFSVTLVFTADQKDELLIFKKQVAAFVKQKLNGKVPKNFKWPWRPGTDRQDDDGNQIEGFPEDCEFIEFWRHESFGEFPVVNQLRKPASQRDIYAGSFGRVCCRPFTYPNHGQGPGCSLGLEAFQKIRDGEPIGGGPVRAEDVFDEVEFEDDDEADLLGVTETDDSSDRDGLPF